MSTMCAFASAQSFSSAVPTPCSHRPLDLDAARRASGVIAAVDGKPWRILHTGVGGCAFEGIKSAPQHALAIDEPLQC